MDVGLSHQVTGELTKKMVYRWNTLSISYNFFFQTCRFENENMFYIPTLVKKTYTD